MLTDLSQVNLTNGQCYYRILRVGLFSSHFASLAVTFSVREHRAVRLVHHQFVLSRILVTVRSRFSQIGSFEVLSLLPGPLVLNHSSFVLMLAALHKPTAFRTANLITSSVKCFTSIQYHGISDQV